MKTTFNFYFICLTAISLAVFASCGDGDTKKPIINLIEPEEGATLKIGDVNGFHFDVELSDDEMLKSYKVDIHSNFDGHTHTASLKSASLETVNFSFSKSWDVSGKKNADIHHHEIVIPANATPGNYHMMVYCTDAAGNEAHVARSIVLSTEDGDDHEHEDDHEGHEH